MKVLDLNRKPFNLDTRESQWPLRDAAASKSRLQYECGQLLKQRFPLDKVLEEVYVERVKVYLDFFLPNRKMVFEIHGRQHDEYIPHFHGSQQGFAHAKTRDANKQQWCDINGFTLYIVRSIEEMTQVLGI